MEHKVLDKGFVRLVDSMGDDSSIVQAARVSYGEGTKTVNDDTGLIRYLLRNQHTSPFEMVEFKFHCKMPIFVARQWIRHRTANVNEISGRYSIMKDEFYEPELNQMKTQSTNNKQGRSDDLIENAEDIKVDLEDNMEKTFADYQYFLNTGLSKELSRIVLPLSTYTEWYWKIDLHNLLHFLKLRLDPHAQYEIRVYAEAMYKIIKDIVPITCESFEDYVLHAKTFSAKEMFLIRLLLKNSVHLESVVKAYGIELNKREKEEFLQKIK